MTMVVLGNFAFMVILLIGRILQLLFLGQAHREEVEDIIQTSKFAVMESLLALTFFRDDLDMKTLGLFVGLHFVKVFHWLAVLRVESIGHNAAITRLDHLRLMALMTLLSAVDFHCSLELLIRVVDHKSFNVLLVFLFEFAILF